MSPSSLCRECSASPDATLRRTAPPPPATTRTRQTLPASCSKSAAAPANHASVPASSGYRKPPRPDRPRGFRLPRSEEHTSELQSRLHLVCRLLLEKKKIT